MKTIETTAMVGEDRKVTVQLPADVLPGPHQIVLIVEGPINQAQQLWTMADWPIHDAALLDPSFTMRREDLYGESGR